MFDWIGASLYVIETRLTWHASVGADSVCYNDDVNDQGEKAVNV